MKDAEKVEAYLLSLETALKGTTSEKRGRIVAEARGIVEESLRQGKPLSQALEAAGSVTSICQKNGISLPRQSGWKRILVLFVFFGFMAMFVTVLAGGWLVSNIWKGWNQGDWVFQMNNSEGLEDEMDQFLLGGRILPKSEEETVIEDKRDVVHYNISSFKVIFPNGKLRFKWVEGNALEWTCKVAGTGREGSAEAADGLLVLDMGNAFGTKCDVKIPKSVSLSVEGINGDIQIVKPTQSVDVQLTNGRVQIDDRSAVEKRFDVSAKNGRVFAFESSKASDAKVIKVTLANGMIGRFEEE